MYSLYTNRKIYTYTLRFDIHTIYIDNVILDVIPLLKILFEKNNILPGGIYDVYPLIKSLSEDVPIIRDSIDAKLAGKAFAGILHIMFGIPYKMECSLLSSKEYVIKNDFLLKQSILNPYICLLQTPSPSLLEISNLYSEHENILYFLIDVLLVDKIRLCTYTMFNNIIPRVVDFTKQHIDHPILSKYIPIVNNMITLYQSYTNDDILYLKSIGMYHISGNAEMIQLSKEQKMTPNIGFVEFYYNTPTINYSINLHLKEGGGIKKFIIHDSLFTNISNNIFHKSNDCDEDKCIDVEEDNIFNESSFTDMLFIMNNNKLYNNITSINWFLCFIQLKFHLISKHLSDVTYVAKKLFPIPTLSSEYITQTMSLLDEPNKPHDLLRDIVNVFIMILFGTAKSIEFFKLKLDMIEKIDLKHEHDLRLLLKSARILHTIL